MSITVYVEGGGTSKDLRTRCREAFHNFLASAGLRGRFPRIVACGSRSDAFDRFRTAVSHNASESCLLLVDSEEPITFEAQK